MSNYKKSLQFINTRKIVLLLLLLLLIVLLTACGNGQGNAPDVTAPVENQAVIPNKLTEEWMQARYPDCTILSWVHNDNVDMPLKRCVAVNDYLYAEGYDFVLMLEQLKADEFERIVNQRIKENKAPDIITAGLGEGGTLQGTAQAIENGWLLSLDRYLASDDGSRLKAVFPDSMWKSFEYNGMVYGASGYLPMATQAGYLVNKTLADKYDISLEELTAAPFEELGGFLERVYQGEKALGTDLEKTLLVLPQGNSISGYIPVRDAKNQTCNALVVKKTGTERTVQNLYATNEAKTAFMALSQYYKSGYLGKYNNDIIVSNFFLTSASLDTSSQKNIAELIDLYKQTYAECGELVFLPKTPYVMYNQGNSITGVCEKSDSTEKALEALSLVFTEAKISDIFL